MQSVVIIDSIMVLFAIVVFTLFIEVSFQKPLQLPLLEHEKASIIIDVNMSSVKSYIDRTIAAEVRSEINKSLTSSIKQHTTHIETEIEEVKAQAIKTEKDVQEKIANLTADLNTIKELQKSNRKQCQSGSFGQHSMKAKFPIEKDIKFDPPFTTTPAFVYGFHTLDSSSNAGVRATASISDLTEKGVKLRLTTWATTTLYGLRVSWMAC